jgi:hypothetical protein
MHNTAAQFAIGAIFVVIASLAGYGSAMAQTPEVNLPPQSSAHPTPTTAVSPGKRQPAGDTQVLEKRSLFFPDLAHGDKPLSASEKFRLALANSISPAAFLGSAFGASFGQAADSPSGYGQGASAYGQRYGASMAKRASANLMGTYLLSSILHDDPRYYVRGDGSLKQSIKYALRRVVIVRKDAGGEAFNWPGILAPLGSAALANTYMPEDQKTVGYTFENYGWSIASAAGVNLLKEYWPTITKKVLVPMGTGHDSEKP